MVQSALTHILLIRVKAEDHEAKIIADQGQGMNVRVQSQDLPLSGNMKPIPRTLFIWSPAF